MTTENNEAETKRVVERHTASGETKVYPLAVDKIGARQTGGEPALADYLVEDEVTILRVTMNLTTAAQQDAWRRVKAHYGDQFSGSATLWDLVRIKDYEIKGERSNRFRLDQIDQRLDRIEKLLQLVHDVLTGQILKRLTNWLKGGQNDVPEHDS
jgi:hypothetical protein